ncbi:MAG: YceI family protein [Saprospiraceae bacterium]|nr:YceI family protein [Saprospiraceae bacterium]
MATGSKTKWVLDPTHSELTFKVKHMMISNVKGSFNNFSIDLKDDNLERSSIAARVEASSINTNSEQRDGHLKSADFFDVENHRELKFKSTSFTKKQNGDFRLKGMLTIKGISKEVEFDVEYGGIHKDPWGNQKAGYSIQGIINRKDWGLNWNAALETGGVLVSEEVKIAGEFQFVNQQ